MTDVTMPRRGPGRPPGSTNRAKLPPPSPEEIATLKDSYAEAITERALANDRTQRLKDLIKTKLGKQGLTSVEEAILAEQRPTSGLETRNDLTDQAEQAA